MTHRLRWAVMLSVLAMIVLGTVASGLPSPGFGGCVTWDGRYLLSVRNAGTAGYIGYDIYGSPPGDPGGIVDLGFFNAGETKSFYLDVPSGTSWTLRKWVKDDVGDAWQMKGGTHVASLSKPSADYCCWDIMGCPTDITVNNDPGHASAVVTWTEPTVESSCCGSIAATTQTHCPGDTFPLGTTTVTYTWTSPSPAVYTKTCTFNVEVIGNYPSASMGGCVTWDGKYRLTVVNNGGPGWIGYDVYGVMGRQDLGYFGTGETKIVLLDAPMVGNWTLRKFVSLDGCTWVQKGGTHSANLNKPASMWCWDIVGCPGNIVVGNDPGLPGAVVSWPEPSVNSTCCGPIPATAQTHTPGAFFPLGTTKVCYTWTSPATGHTRTCEFDVTVNDVEGPIVTIFLPEEDAQYVLGEAILASWIATDPISGLKNVSATAPSGAPIDTGSVGYKDFQVSATDNYNNTTTVLVKYQVVYALSGPAESDGGGGGSLGPLDFTTDGGGGGSGSGPYSVGDPIPVFFTLEDAFGNPIVDAVPTITVVEVVNPGPSEEYVVWHLYVVPYDADQGGYAIAVPTTGLAPGVYDLWLGLGDGTQRVRRIQLQ